MTSLAGKKICLTGATGFLGSHLLPLLKESGAEITCITRRETAIADCRVCRADLASGAGLEVALKGQDMLIHMAALLFGHGWRDYFSANAAAARQIALAARGVERVVHVSSLAAAGPCAEKPGRDENAAPAPVSAYGWSKLLCENILRSQLGARVVVIRPPIIYGSGDRGLLPVFLGIRRGLCAVPGRSFPVSVIHARDAASGILCCLREDAADTYHISDGAPLELADFYRAMGRALGRPNPAIFNVPLPIMGAAAAISGWFGKVGKVWGAPPPKWNYDKFLEASAGGWLADGRRIARELAFIPQVALEAGMAEAVEGYRARGWL